MSLPALFKPHQSATGRPADSDPDTLPVEPDEGPVPPAIPADPEHDRSVDPAG